MSDARWDSFRPPEGRAGASDAPAETEAARDAEPGWRDAPGADTPPEPVLPGAPLLIDNDLLTVDDGAAPEKPSPDRRFVIWLAVICVLLIVAVVALVTSDTRVRRNAAVTPAPVTVTTTETIQVSSAPDFGAGSMVSYPVFGSVPIPVGTTIRNTTASSDSLAVTLSSDLQFIIGTLHSPASDPAALAGPATAWASQQGVTLEQPGAWTSPLGYRALCATAAAPAQGQGCFYPTAGGSTFIWIWTANGVTDDIATAMLNAYVPGT